jgi:hypothetical protein
MQQFTQSMYMLGLGICDRNFRLANVDEHSLRCALHATPLRARRFALALHVEFEAGQREVHVSPSLIDQIARLLPAGRTCARYAFGFEKADGI